MARVTGEILKSHASAICGTGCAVPGCDLASRSFLRSVWPPPMVHPDGDAAARFLHRHLWSQTAAVGARADARLVLVRLTFGERREEG
jgi:hypothetical protein